MTMNTDHINHLADVIAAQPHVGPHAKAGFNMDFWTHGCGTPSCIAGWAASMANADGVWERDSGQSYLGLDNTTSGQLFLGIGRPSGMHLSDITPAHAAAVLRHLAETGRVDWSVGAPT